MLQVKRDVLTKYNVPLSEVNRAVSAGLGGEVAGQVVEGNRKRDIVVRLPEEDRSKEEMMKSLPLRVGDYGMIPLGDAVDIRTEKAVDPIRHSRTQRRAAFRVGVTRRAIECCVNQSSARLTTASLFTADPSLHSGRTLTNLHYAPPRLLNSSPPGPVPSHSHTIAPLFHLPLTHPPAPPSFPLPSAPPGPFEPHGRVLRNRGVRPSAAAEAAADVDGSNGVVPRDDVGAVAAVTERQV